jgi:hypothetical protein
MKPRRNEASLAPAPDLFSETAIAGLIDDLLVPHVFDLLLGKSQ